MSHRCPATSSALREALFVTKSLRPGTSSNDSAAPSVNAWPRNTVPSRSRSKQSYCCASVPTSAELAHSVFGIGDPVDVGGRGAQEPLQRLLATVKRQQCLRVRVEQPCRSRPGARRVQLRCGQDLQGLFELTEVGAGAGGDNAQLVGFVAAELGRLSPARQLKRPLGPAEAALAVDNQRKQRGLAAHPARRAQFGKRLRPVTTLIGRDPARFPDGGDTPRAGAGGPRVAQRGFRIVVDQLACGDQVAGNRVGGGPVQSAELAPDLGRQLLCFDISRDLRGGAAIVVGWMLGLRSARASRARCRCLGPRRSPRPRFAGAAAPFLDHSYPSSRITLTSLYQRIRAG